MAPVGDGRCSRPGIEPSMVRQEFEQVSWQLLADFSHAGWTNSADNVVEGLVGFASNAP